MDLIILNDGLYQLIPVTKEMLGEIKIFTEIDCFDLCDILREKLTGFPVTIVGGMGAVLLTLLMDMIS